MSNDDDANLLARRKACLSRLDRWAHVLDEAIAIPGTRYRIGLDSVVGIVPGIGDLAGLALSSSLLLEALWARAPKRVFLRMCAHVGVDFVIGLIPVLGDIFDITYQANSRNARIFRRWLEAETQPQPETRSRWPIVLAVLGLAGGLVLATILSIFVWQML